MEIRQFEWQFNKVNGFYLTSDWILFRKPLELWNEKTNQTITFKNRQELYEHTLDEITIKDIILKLNSLKIPPIDGGRGASAGNNGIFKFDHTKGNGKDETRDLFPAYANVRIKTKTLESAMEEFRERFKNADREWAYEVDSQGYVHQFKRGGKSNVLIGSRSRETMILHNHPSGGAFSDSDLISTSMDRYSKGIVASGKNYDYVFTKGTHFKANNFVKAVKNAKMPGKDYDDAVDKWLKKNQRKFGYKYYRTKN